MTLSLPNFPLFKNGIDYATSKNGIAIDDIRMGRSFTYLELMQAVAKLRLGLLNGKRYSRPLKEVIKTDIIFLVV